MKIRKLPVFILIILCIIIMSDFKIVTVYADQKA